MGQTITLTADDGHQLSAYRAEPEGTPLAGVIVLQEIFGLTGHIRSVVDEYAGAGYLAIAPAMFDRTEADATFDYTNFEPALEMMRTLSDEQAVLDMGAAVQAASEAGSVGAVGYCWGGAMVYLAACELDIRAASSYYGRAIERMLDKIPRCPVMYHFGATDQSIPMELVNKIKAARPEGTFFIYENAGHGFNCTERPDYHPDSADLARKRSLEFFQRYLQT